MDDETINQAVSAMDRALAAGRTMQAAMRAALAAVASTGHTEEFEIVLQGVELSVGFADIEDEWTIKAMPGADLSPLLMESDLSGAIDALTVKAMKRDAARNAADDVADQHAAQRAERGL